MTNDDEIRDGVTPGLRDDEGAERDLGGERRVAGWQRALRWVAWLTFLGLAVANSDSVSFGGVGATGAIVYDLATGRATVGEIVKDIAIFVESWIVEVVTRGAVDGEVEKTHAYALFVLLLPGLALLAINLVPFVRRGLRWRVEPDRSVSVLRGSWVPLLEYEFAAVSADGTTVTFRPPPNGDTPVVLPQRRVFAVRTGARLRPELSAEFFSTRLVERGFVLDDTSRAAASSFTARRR